MAFVLDNAWNSITSPRVRGEVEICAKREFRVRGAIREANSAERPARGEGAEASRPNLMTS
jgi:hypothetical protein